MRRKLAGMLGALAALPLVACDPPPPRPQLTVTTVASGADAVPGDGVCEVTPGSGDCTLEAAIAEGNALGAADIALPSGTYASGPLTVTGALSINLGGPSQVELVDQVVTVAAGASLVVERVHT